MGTNARIHRAGSIGRSYGRPSSRFGVGLLPHEYSCANAVDQHRFVGRSERAVRVVRLLPGHFSTLRLLLPRALRDPRSEAQRVLRPARRYAAHLAQ